MNLYNVKRNQMINMKELIVSETRIVMLPDKVIFSPTRYDWQVFATFYIPAQFNDCGIEFYDLYLEQGYPTVFLGCRGYYDVAIHLNEKDGKMIDWHYTK